MVSLFAADAVLVFHLAFILFSGLGALLVLRRRWIALLQLPAAAWGFFVEITGRSCPLTRLENHFLALAGRAGYEGDFLQHYLLGAIYPEGLTRNIQFMLAVVVIAANVCIYGWLLYRRAKRR